MGTARREGMQGPVREPSCRLPSPAWCLIALLVALPARAFDYFEHRFIGNSAFENALSELRKRDPGRAGSIETIAQKRLGFGRQEKAPADAAGRLLQKLPLRFGDLSALAGDFSGDERNLKRLVANILLETSPVRTLMVDTRRQWVNACRWLYRSRGGSVSPDPDSDWEGCFQRLAGEGDLQKRALSEFGSAGYQPTREELAGNEMTPGYIALASQNKSHFPRHSWKSYGDYHRKALDFASCFRGGRACPGPDGEDLSGDALLVEALLNEAFAQHFLHDSFASGHIGTSYGKCFIEILGIHCRPTKRRMLHTHDALNQFGLKVRIGDPLPRLADAAAQLRQGWTAFGDDHLFIREADFHRAVVVVTATESMKEVLNHASEAQGGGGCGMCTTAVFPVPEDENLLSEDSKKNRAATDLLADYEAGDLVQFEEEKNLFFEKRSRDPRISRIPAEGWKVGYGFARQYLGGTVRTAPLETGAQFRLDYLRNTDPRYPNAFGFEYWGLPNFRSSYVFSLGYSWPREAAPLSVAIRVKYGWRIEDTFTRNNPTPQRIGGQELTLPSVELVYDLYPPVTLFVQYNMATFHYPHNERRQSELIHHGEYTMSWGVRFDISGI